jgi:micrococcal nuclease
MTAALLAVLLVLPAPFDGRVVAVHDGDTISVLREGRSVRLRLHDIDCPELGQVLRPRGEADDLRAGLQAGCPPVHVVPVDIDQYGRLVARAFVGSTSINLELVRRGFAWHFTRNARDAALANAERAARSARRGLWADPRPIPPWTWRHSRTP